MTLWRVIRTATISVEFVTLTFLLFLIWETTADLYNILLFSLFFFLTIPFASFLSGILTDRVSPKLALFISHAIQIVQLLFLILFYGNFSSEFLIVLGILGGAADGFRSISFNYIDTSSAMSDDSAKNFAGRNVIIRITHLFLPLLAGIIVSQRGSYLLLFTLTILVHIVISILIVFFKSPTHKSKFMISEILNFPGQNEEKKILAKSAFFEGLFDGITLTILPIVVLSFVGSVFNWSLLNTLIIMGSLIVSLILIKVINDKSSQWMYAVGAITFAAASILLITQYSFYIIMIFLLAMSFMEVIKEIGYHSAVERIIKTDRDEYMLVSEYKIIVQIFASIGKLIPILLLMFMGIDINNEFVIRLTLLIAGLLPLLVLSVLGQSVIFDTEYEDEFHLHNAVDLEDRSQPDTVRSKEVHIKTRDEDIPSLGKSEQATSTWKL